MSRWRRRPAAGGRGVQAAVLISLLLIASLVLAPAAQTAGSLATRGLETRSHVGLGPTYAGFETAPSWVGTWMSAQQLLQPGLILNPYNRTNWLKRLA